MSVRVTVAGRVGVERDGARLDSSVLAARRSRLILAALASSPSGLAGRALAERVWADPPSTWAAALRGAIAAFRGALTPLALDGQELIVTTSTGWALASGVEVDLDAADAAVAAAEVALAQARPEAALELVGSLREFGRLDVLPDDEADWIDDLRARHSRASSRALAVMAESSIALGRHAAAIEAAETMIAADPIDERAHRTLITALAGSGDRAGAIRAFERCRELLVEELGVDPSADTAAVYLEVLRSGGGASGSVPSLPRNAFFGRQRELAAVATYLREPGVVTLTGRGGVGKSRLALECAHAAVATLPGGRFWAALGDVNESELVAVTVAAAIGADATDDPIAAVIARLAPAGDVLIILDGCEHALDGTIDAVNRLVEAVPTLRVLITTRSPLALDRARNVEVAPLAIPAADDPELARSAAVQLLADRMALRGARLALGSRNAAPIRELCERCGGVPLALELAAAQLASMAVGDLLDSLPSAAEGAMAVMDALLTQSYEGLDPDESAVFRAWAVVEGALPLALVRGLVGSLVPLGRVARVLTSLADAGLVTVDRSGPRWSYRMDDQVRHLAQGLASAGEAEAALDGLIGALRSVLPDTPQSPPGPFRDAIDDAADGFRTVFAATATQRVRVDVGLELAFRLHRYWAVTRLAEGRYWLGRLRTVHDAEGSRWAAFVDFAHGYLAYWSGDPVGALPHLQFAARELRGVDDVFATRALMFVAGITDDLDQPDEAIRAIEEAVELAEGTGDANLQVSATCVIANILAERGDAESVVWARRALAVCRERGSMDQLYATLSVAAFAAWMVGRTDDAREFIDEASPILGEGARISRITLATVSAGMSLLAGQLDRAAELAALSVADAEELGVDHELPLALAVAARVALSRNAIEHATHVARRCVAAAQSVTFRYPVAVALETASEVARVRGRSAIEVAPLLLAAASVRAAGRRPAPVSLRVALPEPPQGEVDIDAACSLALSLLG